MLKTIDRYILKSHIGPFFFALVTLTVLLVLQFFSTFADRFIGKGIGFEVIVKLIMFQSAWMVGLAAPMAVLVAVVMTFGTLTSTSEMTVFRASGISLYRLMIPVLIAGLFLSAVVERFNNVLLPQANYQAKSMMVDITKSTPAFGLTENAFSTLVNGYSIFIRKSDDQLKELQGIVIYDVSRPDQSTMVTAERGRIDFSPDFQYLIMTLHNGEIYQVCPPAHKTCRAMSFVKQRFVFESSLSGFVRSSGNRIRSGDDELSASELLVIGNEFLQRMQTSEQRIRHPVEALEKLMAQLKPASSGAVSANSYSSKAITRASSFVESQLAQLDGELESIASNQSMYNRYMASYHKKYALSLACFIFVLVGAPLGVLARRGGFGAGAAISLLFFVLYWALLIGGKTIAERGILDPMISMWLANIVMSIIGLWLVISLSGAVFNTSR